MKVKSLKSCPILSNPMDCSLPGFSIHGIFQAGVLEWGAIAFSGYDARIFIFIVLNNPEMSPGRQIFSPVIKWRLSVLWFSQVECGRAEIRTQEPEAKGGHKYPPCYLSQRIVLGLNGEKCSVSCLIHMCL